MFGVSWYTILHPCKGNDLSLILLRLQSKIEINRKEKKKRRRKKEEKKGKKKKKEEEEKKLKNKQ